MLPIPSRSALFLFAGCCATLAVGLFARSPIAIVLATDLLLILAGALALTMPLGARLRKERLEFAWWQTHSERGPDEGAIAGAPFELRAYVRNHSERSLRFDDLLPVMPAGVQLLSGEHKTLSLPPRTRTEFGFTLSASAAGRSVLQGLSVLVPGPLSLFHAPLYFPSPLAVKVLPRSAARRAALELVAGGQQVERTGLSPLRRRGGGTELHELREHRPGDPFKSIAWKPSARTGRLLVREVENEVQETIYLVLDVSGTMRGGRPGERKLDHGIELCAMTARIALERGDRVGLITVDGRIVSHVKPAEGAAHVVRIYEALLHATEIVDADLTEPDDDAVAAMVARYLRQQEGRELTLSGERGLGALVEYAKRALAAERAGDEVTASSPRHALLRRFCRSRGIPLAYRADTRAFSKGAGLCSALRQAGGQTRMPRMLLCISDLDGVIELEPLQKTISMLRAHHHSVAFLFPDAESLSQAHAEDAALERDLRHVYALEERRRLAEARAALARLGTPVLPFGVGDDKAKLARRLHTSRR